MDSERADRLTNAWLNGGDTEGASEHELGIAYMCSRRGRALIGAGVALDILGRRMSEDRPTDDQQS